MGEFNMMTTFTEVSLRGGAKRSDPVPLPQPEPRIVRIHFVVPSVGGVAVGQLERSGVRN
jgi:hypothetical protein